VVPKLSPRGDAGLASTHDSLVGVPVLFRVCNFANDKAEKEIKLGAVVIRTIHDNYCQWCTHCMERECSGGPRGITRNLISFLI